MIKKHGWKIGEKFVRPGVSIVKLLVLGFMGVANVAFSQANEGLEQSLVEAGEEPSIVFGTQGLLIEGWRSRMQDFGYEVQFDPPSVSPDLGGGKYITSAMVSVQVPPGNPGFIESRVKAIELAQLEAKGELIGMFATEVGGSRFLDAMEKSSWADGSVAEIRNLGTLDRIVSKGEVLAEKTLDAAILAVDPDYDPSAYASQEEKLIVASEVVGSEVRVRALQSVAGAATVFSAEGYLNVDGVEDYAVIVSMIWTPKLQKVASAMHNHYYQIPKMDPNVPVDEQIPSDPETLVANIGVRVVIDENGQYALLSFAQAEPQYVSSSRRAKAIQRAKKVARVRAMGYLRNFIGETVSFRQEEGSAQISVEFNEGSSGVENIRQFAESRRGVASSLKLVGMQSKGDWAGRHPASDQTVAGSIVAWTPTQQEMAQSLKADLAGTKRKEQEEDDSAKKEFAIESMQININKY